jgi:hypothetical protein
VAAIGSVHPFALPAYPEQPAALGNINALSGSGSPAILGTTRT